MTADLPPDVSPDDADIVDGQLEPRIPLEARQAETMSSQKASGRGPVLGRPVPTLGTGLLREIAEDAGPAWPVRETTAVGNRIGCP